MEKLAILLVIIMIIIESLSQSCLQLAGELNSMMYLVIGMFLYMFIAVIYYYILKNKTKLSIGNALWNVGTIISVTFISIFIFKQNINIYQLFGILFCCIGVFLIIGYDN